MNAISTSLHPDAQRLAINAGWMLKLRWVAVAGQLVTIAIVAGPLRISLPMGPLLVMVALTAGTNAAFYAWMIRERSSGVRIRPQAWHAILGGLMVLDLVSLTVMLGFTGGPTNPFVLFYFVNLALGGVLLPARWAWLLVVMATSAFTMISYVHSPLAPLREQERLLSFRELGGMTVVGGGALIGFAACGSVIVSFTTWLTRELRRNQEARFRAEEQRAQSEKLEALGTLAAGAAHELATPLSTIAVVAKELENELTAYDLSPEAATDIKLIRSELDRCRSILDRMAFAAGSAAGEAPEAVTAKRLMQAVLEDLPSAEQVELTWKGESQQASVLAPPMALAQAVRALIQNALDASQRQPVQAEVRAGQLLAIAIRDAGPGMPEEVLARAGEPFFTTKEPGKGMGLGVFLARSVIERLGGSLAITSRAGEGTIVEVRLPLSRPSAG